MLPPERWALTPPFHPYRNALANRRRLAGLPASCHRAAHSGGLSFCGTIRKQQRKLSLALPLPWRYQARCPFLPAPTLRSTLRSWCPDFPPVDPERPQWSEGRALRSLRLAEPTSDHPAHPPNRLYRDFPRDQPAGSGSAIGILTGSTSSSATSYSVIGQYRHRMYAKADQHAIRKNGLVESGGFISASIKIFETA
jgi:hypothetical protein